MNAVYVSLDYYAADKLRDAFTCSSLNRISGCPPAATSPGSQRRGALAPLQVKVRHGETMYKCKEFEWRDAGRSAYVSIDGNDQGLAAGQYAVFYQAAVCLGCGVITRGFSTAENA